MRNILLKIEYDGTGFSGWARQPGQRTVQGELERVLNTICRSRTQSVEAGEKAETDPAPDVPGSRIGTVSADVDGMSETDSAPGIILNGTGRTDAGVHALGQRATFSGDFSIPTERIMLAANDMLAESRFKGGDVRITEVQEVPEGFHARFDAVGKTYIYMIRTGDMPVYLRNYRYQVKKPLDTEAMQKAAEHIAGTHDFACFQASGGTPRETTVRTIYGINVDIPAPPASHPYGRLLPPEGASQSSAPAPGDIAISVTGDGFLYNMVRIIAGTLVDVGLGRIDPDMLPEIIASKDRTKAGHTAPPQGLFMGEVYFHKEEMLAAAARESDNIGRLIDRIPHAD